MKTWLTSGGTSIIRVLCGRSNVYLMSRGKSRLLIDTGWKGDGQRLLKRLAITGHPDAVILTHTHFDHAGNAWILHKRFAPTFIVEENEKDFLENGYSPVPNGTMRWTRFLYRLGAEKVPHWFQVQGVKANMTFHEQHDLSEYGFNAVALHTPGHSAGSSSVIVGTEMAIVGDAMVGLPHRIFPPWGDDAEEIIRSWKKLLDTGCQIFHPAHGFPVTRQRLEKEYWKNTSHGASYLHHA